jgi:hypothetical protein
VVKPERDETPVLITAAAQSFDDDLAAHRRKWAAPLRIVAAPPARVILRAAHRRGGWWPSPGAPSGMESFSARGTDEQVHVVDAPMEALVDPSPYRARCGQQVIELYNDGRDPTCSACATGD